MIKKIGIMGGTFDPIHIGHLLLGERAFEQFQLDKVLFMPAGKPPHKSIRAGGAKDEDRVEMVKRAISSNPNFELSLHEMDKEGYSFTYETLEELHTQNPEVIYYFIIGADSLFDLPKWRNPESICKNCILCVALRDEKSTKDLLGQIGFLKEQYGGKYEILYVPSIELASHELRERVKQDKSIKYCVTEPVLSYIQDKGLYKV